MIGIVIVIIFCISIVSLILSSLSYVKSNKNDKMSSTISNQTNSNLITIPLKKITKGSVPEFRASYDIKNGEYIFITQISNLKPNCPVQLSFNDLVANLPVDNNGIAYPGGEKGQSLWLILLPNNDIKLAAQDNWSKTPTGTFSRLTYPDTTRFQMQLVNSQNCNYSQSDIVSKKAIIQDGGFGFPNLQNVFPTY